MDFLELIEKRRTIRLFLDKPVHKEDLVKIVNLARLAPCGANLQPLKYFVLHSKKITEEIFPFTKWAGYLVNGTPPEGKRPTAYILVLVDKSIKQSADTDAGIAIENMVLGAEAMGLGSCILGALDRPAITKLCEIPENFELHSAIALGYPDMTAGVTETADGNIKYFNNEQGEFLVPKRSLEEVLFGTK